MVWKRIKDSLGFGEPTLPEGEPTRLPQYFPVEPKGCEKVSQNLFACLQNEATAKARDMERLGVHKSYFPDVQVKPTDERAVKAVQQQQEKQQTTTTTSDEQEPSVNTNIPKVGDNPLDECRKFVAYYQHCCDRQLKKKKNWILKEKVRVQEEYRYIGPNADGGSK